LIKGVILPVLQMNKLRQRRVKSLPKSFSWDLLEPGLLTLLYAPRGRRRGGEQRVWGADRCSISGGKEWEF
jgi:hypothetical protein